MTQPSPPFVDEVPVPAAPIADRPSLGIAMMLAAQALNSITDGMCKYLGEMGMHSMQIAWGRFLFMAMFLAPAVVALGFRPLRTKRLGLQIMRGLAMLIASTAFIVAVTVLPLADATALAFVTPFFVTVLAIPLVGEKIGIRRWAAVAVGFIGVLIIVRPGGGGFGISALIPVGSAAAGALGLVLARMMGREESALTTMVFSVVVPLIALSAVVPFFWQPLDMPMLLLLFAIGGLAAAGQYALIMAFQEAQPSLVAPFHYSQILWATLVGFALFGALPDEWTLVGAAIIITGGIYTWHRERRRSDPAG